MAQQTALNWIINKFNYIGCIYADDMEDGQMIESAINIAREMEKEQIMSAYSDGVFDGALTDEFYEDSKVSGEQYYNETYNNEKDT